MQCLVALNDIQHRQEIKDELLYANADQVDAYYDLESIITYYWRKQTGGSGNEG